MSWYFRNVVFYVIVFSAYITIFFGRFNVSCSKMCMVGDRLDTDILFGQNAGCKTLLVLSGNGIVFFCIYITREVVHNILR